MNPMRNDKDLPASSSHKPISNRVNDVPQMVPQRTGSSMSLALSLMAFRPSGKRTAKRTFLILAEAGIYQFDLLCKNRWMEERAQTQRDTGATFGRTLRSELFGPPRLGRQAQFYVVFFGLLLVVSLAIPALAGFEASPGLAMLFVGLMIMGGFAELLDPRQRRFIVTLRLAGAGTALLGAVLQFL